MGSGNEPRETYGRLFWISLVAGWGLIGFGLLVILQGLTFVVSLFYGVWRYR